MSTKLAASTLIESFRDPFLKLEALCRYCLSADGQKEIETNYMSVDDKISKAVLHLEIIEEKTELEHFSYSQPNLSPILTNAFTETGVETSSYWKDDTLGAGFNISGYRAYSAYLDYKKAILSLFDKGPEIDVVTEVLKASEQLKDRLPELDLNVVLTCPNNGNVLKGLQQKLRLMGLSKLSSVSATENFDDLDYQIKLSQNIKIAEDIAEFCHDYGVLPSGDKHKTATKGKSHIVALSQQLSVFYGVGANRAARQLIHFAEQHDPQVTHRKLLEQPEFFSDHFRGWLNLDKSKDLETFVAEAIDLAYQPADHIPAEKTLLHKLHDVCAMIERNSNFEIQFLQTSSHTTVIQSTAAKLGAAVALYDLLDRPVEEQTRQIEEWRSEKTAEILPREALGSPELQKKCLAIIIIDLATQDAPRTDEEVVFFQKTCDRFKEAYGLAIKESYDDLAQIAQENDRFYGHLRSLDRHLETAGRNKTSPRIKFKLKP